MLRAALAALLLSAAPALADGPEVHDAYALVTRPGAPTGTAYMVIHNHGATGDRLLGASSPVAERVQIHASLVENGVSRMETVEEGLDLPPEGEIRLERGGLHLMVLGIADPLEDGDVIPMTLHFAQAGDLDVDVLVDLSRLTGDPAAHDDGADGHAGH